MSEEVRDKVLIVGAGLAGLMLAQFLRKESIAFEIFERDEFVDSRKGGWGLSLVEALPILAELLPEDVKDVEKASVNYTTGEPDVMQTYDIMNNKAGFRLGGIKPGNEGYYMRADRQTLRRLLWRNLNIHTGKQFDRYESTPEGQVTAFFKDGTAYKGSILVGADGANSRVRRQLLGSDEGRAVLSKYIPIWADIELTEEQAVPYNKLSNALTIAAAPGVFIAVGRKPIDKSASAQYYWNICFRSENAEEDAAQIATATQEQLYERSLALTRNWPDLMRDLVHKYTKAEDMSTSPPRFYEFVPPQTLPGGQVTLIGDALHPMVPFRGAGANTAAKDARDLMYLIKRVCVDRKQVEASAWSDILREYSAIAAPRGIEMVESSRAAGEQNVGKPGDDPMAELRKGRRAEDSK